MSAALLYCILPLRQDTLNSWLLLTRRRLHHRTSNCIPKAKTSEATPPVT